jgi:xanthine dehydrogenase YagS FAD-binding subunit
MKNFEYHKATTVAQVVTLLGRHGEKAAILAGGSDLLSLMKDRVEGPKLQSPQHLLDIKEIKELKDIRAQKNGLKIGAAVTLSDMAVTSPVLSQYPLLASAAGQVGSPQIRNVGTLGGNLCQRPRCWYFRGRLFKDCLRKGGKDCYAQGGENQYHAIFSSDTCAMVCPSDLAMALTALKARLEIATPKGNRLIPAEEFYVKPDKNILRETILGSSEMVVAVHLPAPAPNSRGTFLKLKEREAFDFALVSAAVIVTLENRRIAEARVVLGGVAPYPFQASGAEKVLKGKTIEEAFIPAAKAAVERAQILSKNSYKVRAARGLIEKALSALA